MHRQGSPILVTLRGQLLISQANGINFQLLL